MSATGGYTVVGSDLFDIDNEEKKEDVTEKSAAEIALEFDAEHSSDPVEGERGSFYNPSRSNTTARFLRSKVGDEDLIIARKIMSGTPRDVALGKRMTVLDRVKAIRSTILTVGRKQPKDKEARKKVELSMFEVGDADATDSRQDEGPISREASPPLGKEEMHGKAEYRLSNDKSTFKYLGKDSEKGDVPVSEGLTSQEAAARLATYGPNKLPEKKNSKLYIFASQLWQPMPLMIWAAIFVEICILNFLDMFILLFIQLANASLGFYEINKADNAIEALKSGLKNEAWVKRLGDSNFNDENGHPAFRKINSNDLVPGDIIKVYVGNVVPADCLVNPARPPMEITEIEVDMSSLNGESLPAKVGAAGEIFMGTALKRGDCEATVIATGAGTSMGRTASLMQGPTENNLMKVLNSIVAILVLISIIMCAIVFVYLLTITTITEALSFVVVLMVASVPMAVELVTTTTLAVGSKALSHEGAVVKQLSAIEDLAGMSILCSDKTGTLTLNEMKLQKVPPSCIFKEGEDRASLVRYAAMAAHWNEPAQDALDTLIFTAPEFNKKEINELVEYVSGIEFDAIVKRSEGTLKDRKTGKIFKTSKGAPKVILKLVYGDNITHPEREKIEAENVKLAADGIRTLAIAKTKDKEDPSEKDEWQLLGLLPFLDPPRPDSKDTIKNARALGVTVKMITGDNYLIARQTAKELELGDFITSSEGLPVMDPKTMQKPPHLSINYGDRLLTTDGFAQVIPEHKYLIVECFRELGYKVGMTGDGVNDAPALKRADVGIAVMGCTGAAQSASGIYLTRPGLSTIVDGIKISRCIFVRIRNFLIYRIAATLQLLLFFFIAVFAFKPYQFQPADYKSNPNFPDNFDWPIFFHLPVLLLMLITVLNDGTMIAIGYDNVTPLPTPEKWNRPVLFVVASTLAGVALISSLLLLHMLLDSWNPTGFFQVYVWPDGLSFGQIVTAIYLKVSISDFLTLFSSRTGQDWFFSHPPARILILAAGTALSASTIVASLLLKQDLDGIWTMGLSWREPFHLPFFIWIYCIVWWFVQDACKVAVYHLLLKYNMFGINDTGKFVFTASNKEYMAKNRLRVIKRGVPNNVKDPADPLDVPSNDPLLIPPQDLPEKRASFETINQPTYSYSAEGVKGSGILKPSGLMSVCLTASDTERNDCKLITGIYLLLTAGLVTSLALLAASFDGILHITPIEACIPLLAWLAICIIFMTVSLLSSSYSGPSPASVTLYLMLCMISVLALALSPQGTSFLIRLAPFFVANALSPIYFLELFINSLTIKQKLIWPLFWIPQLVFICLKLDSTVNWSWAITLFPSYVVCTLVVMYRLVSSVRTCFVSSNQERTSFPCSLLFGCLFLPLCISIVLLGIKQTLKLTCVQLVSPIFAGYVLAAAYLLFLQFLDITDYIMSMQHTMVMTSESKSLVNKDVERRRVTSYSNLTTQGMNDNTLSLDNINLINPTINIMIHDGELVEVEQARAAFESAILKLSSATTTGAWIKGLRNLRRVVVSNIAVRAHRDRQVIVENVGRRIPEAKKAGLWTKEVGLEYSYLLREFTIVRSIARSLSTEYGL